jgi:hypothetical protein
MFSMFMMSVAYFIRILLKKKNKKESVFSGKARGIIYSVASYSSVLTVEVNTH